MDNVTNTEHGNGAASPAESDASVGAKLRDKAHDAREQIAEKRRASTTRIKTEGEHLLRNQKNRVADRIDHYGNAVHRAASKLEGDQDAAMAQYTHRAAEQLERAARYLRGRDWRDLRRDAESFARRHQEVLLCGLLLGGVVVARFLKASSHEDEWYAGKDEPGTTHEPSPQAGIDSAGDSGSM